MKKRYISASLLAADRFALKSEIERVNNSEIDYIHFDVMDNIFVDNTSFNDDTFQKVRSYSSLPFEIHLMVNNPFAYIDNYDYSHGDIIIVHYESFKTEEDLFICLKRIKRNHLVGLSIKPSTDVKLIDKFLPILDYILIMSVEPGYGGQKFLDNALDKIAYFASKQDEYHYLIEVDGGINDKNAHLCYEKGADILVSGSYLFKGNMLENGRKLR